MIRRIQALNYRCLRYVDVALGEYQLLVGPNASGKSTLFDVITFLSDLVSEGLEEAIGKRTENFRDLVWGQQEDTPRFELAIEFDLPRKVRRKLPEEKNFRIFRYEISICRYEKGVIIESERGLLMPRPAQAPRRQPILFPDPPAPVTSILLGGRKTGKRTILSKSKLGSADSFSSEVSEKSGRGWVTNISFGPQRSTLRNLPESPDKFPAATYVKRVLEEKVKPLFLNSLKLRHPSPPSLKPKGFSPDGSNLPWTIRRLQTDHPKDYTAWPTHVKTVLDDLNSIRIKIRPEDQHAYLILIYNTGARIPSWTASDGTLRLLALTLLAYLPDSEETYLLEEPENGIHPTAIESIYQSLTSVYDSQIMFATHSPSVLRLAEPEKVLCFAKNDTGATDIIRGDEHPRLRGWRDNMSSTDMELLFVKGVLG